MKVVIATDGSDAAIEAARTALSLLRPDAEVALLAVVPSWEDPMETAGGIEGPAFTEEEADEEYRDGVSDGRQALARTARAIGTEVEAVLLPSDAPADQAIVEIAELHRADVLVLGSEQPGFFQRIFGRTVTDQVLHHAPCPVLVVPHTG